MSAFVGYPCVCGTRQRLLSPVPEAVGSRSHRGSAPGRQRRAAALVPAAAAAVVIAPATASAAPPPRLGLEHPCPESDAEAVERALRALDAEAAADAAHVALACASANPVPMSVPTAGHDANSNNAAVGVVHNGHRPGFILPGRWRDVLRQLADVGFRGEALSHLVERGGVMFVLALDPDRVHAVLAFLKGELGFSEVKLRQIIATRPVLLVEEDSIRGCVDVLRHIYFTNRDIQNTAFKWPRLLSLDFERALAAIEYLCMPSVGFTPKSLRSVVRRAPWILAYDIKLHMAPVLSWLRKSFLLRSSVTSCLSLESIVRACPIILCTSPENIHDVVEFFQTSLHAPDDMIISIVRQFPPILTSLVEETLRPTSRYLSEELGLPIPVLQRIIRAFPAILCLDVETEIVPNVRFFREHGIDNVGRIVSRLPPVLSYDIKTNLAPKMEFLMRGLGLSTYDVLLFPGYFSYSLTECIEPRTRFLQKLGVPLTAFGLNMALSTTDDVFCKRVAKADVDAYRSFHQALNERRLLLQEQLEADSGRESSSVMMRSCFPSVALGDEQQSSEISSLSLASESEATTYLGEASHSDEDMDDESDPAALPKSLVPITPPQPRRRRRKLSTTDPRVPWRNSSGASN